MIMIIDIDIDHDDEDEDNEDGDDDDEDIDDDDEEKLRVCASKVYTSAEFKREKDNFQSLCKNLERTETKRSDYYYALSHDGDKDDEFHSLWKKLKWIEIKKPRIFHAEQMLKSSFDPQNGRWPHDLVLES